MAAAEKGVRSCHNSVVGEVHNLAEGEESHSCLGVESRNLEVQGYCILVV